MLAYSVWYPKEPSPVTPALCLGDSSHGANRTLIDQCGFTAVINLTQVTHANDLLASGEEQLPFAYHHLPIDDHPKRKISEYFERSTSVIEAESSKRGKVLVHCGQGVSRAATIVLAYLVSGSPRMSLREAFLFLHKRRPCIDPNNGFMRQLVELERTTHSGRVSLDPKLYADDWGFGNLELIREAQRTKTNASTEQKRVEQS